MTHLNGGEAHGRRQVALLPERIAEKVEARRLVEGTTLSMRAIGQQLRIPKTTLWHWKEDGGWQRPEGAPLPLDQIPRIVEQRTEKRREVLVDRLYRVFDRQLMDVESRAADAVAMTEEKDARTLGTLARTLGTLIALETGGERDEGAPADAPEPYDPDEIRARLAQRLAGLREDEEG